MGVFTAIMATAAVGSAVAQSNQARAQRRASRAQQRQADIANARERRAAIRNARVARASVESQAATTGISGSSGVSASLANIQSRTAENISFLDQNIALMEQASRANEQAAMWAGRASTFQAIGELSQTAGNYFGNQNPFKKTKETMGGFNGLGNVSGIGRGLAGGSKWGP